MDLTGTEEAWKNAVGDALKRTLAAQSFQSQTNSSQLLAFMYLLNSKLDRFVSIFSGD